MFAAASVFAAANKGAVFACGCILLMTSYSPVAVTKQITHQDLILIASNQHQESTPPNTETSAISMTQANVYAPVEPQYVPAMQAVHAEPPAARERIELST